MSISFAPEVPITQSSDKPVNHNFLEAQLTKVKSFVSRLEPGIAANIRTEYFFTKFNLFGSGYFRTGTEERYFKEQFRRETLGIRLEKLMKEQESNPYSVQLNQKLAATAEALRKAEDRLRNPDRLHIANEELIAIDAIQLAGLYEQLKGTRDKTAREEIMRNIKDYIAKASEGKIHQDFPNNAS